MWLHSLRQSHQKALQGSLRQPHLRAIKLCCREAAGFHWAAQFALFAAILTLEAQEVEVPELLFLPILLPNPFEDWRVLEAQEAPFLLSMEFPWVFLLLREEALEEHMRFLTCLMAP